MIYTNNLKKWFTFTWERFPPLSYIPFLSLYFIAHYVFSVDQNNHSLFPLLILYLATLIFFFKLRLYDEVKDFDSDLKIYPDRPLSRGLLNHSSIYFGIFACIFFELTIFAMFGSVGLSALIIPVAYSLLMFKEFFVRKWIRSHLTLYAITHTFVSSLFSLALLSVLQSTYIWNLGVSSYIFALLSWCLFNIFEFGRKTFISSEEKKNVDSYSKIYGRFGASLLVISMAICSLVILSAIQSPESTIFFVSILVTLLAIVALLFIKLDKEPLGKTYRGISSAFIAFVYLIFIIANRIS